MTPKPLFQSLASTSLDLVKATYTQRGTEYADTWRTCQWITLHSVARKLGIPLSQEHCRAIALASLVDCKRERMAGGYKEDSLIDGIAYEAALIGEMQGLSGAPKVPEVHDGQCKGCGRASVYPYCNSCLIAAGAA